MHQHRSSFVLGFVGVWIALAAGCGSPPAPKPADGPVTIRPAERTSPPALTPPGTPAPAASYDLRLARNETGGFAVTLASLKRPEGNKLLQLRIGDLSASTGGTIPAAAIRPFQMLAMPLDLYRAAYVRHSGRDSSLDALPRALLPITPTDRLITLGRLRDPGNPYSPQSAFRFDRPLDLWFDVPVSAQTPAGEYRGKLDILETGNASPVASLELKLTVYDFVLSDDRNLRMTGTVAWEDLQRLWPTTFETVSPKRINRGDPAYADAVGKLDALVKLAHDNRVEVTIPRLQPTVKWPAGQPPSFDWRDFDSVVRPWLTGEAFADRVPLGYWPLPAIDYLDNYAPVARLEYWASTAAHFDQMEWLARAPVWLPPPAGKRPSVNDRFTLSAEAAKILSANGRVKVTLPLEPDQIQFGGDGLLTTDQAARIIPTSPGLISGTPIQRWPVGDAPPPTWLRTDLPGLISYVGAGGDETDVRVWSWLAFLRNAPLIQWPSALPSTSKPTDIADPNELVWFYPGEWFGVAEPLPTLQLKWLRRAQQDYEYLNLARQRGERINAIVIARLLTKPVEIQATQEPDARFGLMTGLADPLAWEQALSLVARNILLRDPSIAVDEKRRQDLNLETLQWIQPRERPLVLAGDAQWTLGDPTNPNGPPTFFLRLGVDVYNASDSMPERNALGYGAVPPGWVVQPAPVNVPPLGVFRIQSFPLAARIDPDKVDNRQRIPTQLVFTQGFKQTETRAAAVLPVVNSLRRVGPLSIDGSLGDWTDDEAICEQPLSRLLDRPGVQREEIRPAATPTSLYTGWTDDQFYVAFKAGGIEVPRPGDVLQGRNFVSYENGRAWGEDLVQMLIQPIYADKSVGPLLHVVCKPNGSSWGERQIKEAADPWQPFESGIRYQATVATSERAWRGEVAIPWKAFADPAKGRPVALKYNFIQHKLATGESASWAAPLDTGRDDRVTGIIVLRELSQPGMIGR